MATAMIYDTLKLAEQLEHEAGFDSARAKAMARIMADNSGGNLATREDLLLVKGDLREEILALRAEMHGLISELRAEMHASISELRSEMHALRSDLDAKISALDGKIRVLYWMTGTTLAGVAALLGTAIAIALHIMRLG
ncbi:MAG TPA: hypothetical protein VGR92_18345 [Steroidobacteraceae bacterium]|nr:hypothetical protein [Steroidobacteraceae bacterium]